MEPLERLIHIIIDKKPAVITTGTIKSVDIEKRTCVVALSDDKAELEDVRLNSIIADYTNHLLIVPKKDSIVILARMDGQKTEAVIIAFSEVEEVHIKIDETSAQINKDGIAYKTCQTYKEPPRAKGYTKSMGQTNRAFQRYKSNHGRSKSIYRY